MNALAMTKLLGAGLLTLVVSAPAFGQKMGSTNRNAPAVTQSIAFGKNSIEVKYTAITWAGGQWAKQLADEATRADMRTMINAGAEKSPLGSITTPVALTIGKQKVAAGTYKLAFVVSEQFKWQISLIGEGGTVICPLELKDGDDETKRLVVTLRAGEKDNTAEIVVGFGKGRCVLPVTIEA